MRTRAYGKTLPKPETVKITRCERKWCHCWKGATGETRGYSNSPICWWLRIASVEDVTQERLLLELEKELAKGRIVEARMQNLAFQYDGLCDFGSKTIYIDHRPAIVETVLHELLHRRWPALTEEQVDRKAKRLLAKLDHRGVER